LLLYNMLRNWEIIIQFFGNCYCHCNFHILFVIAYNMLGLGYRNWPQKIKMTLIIIMTLFHSQFLIFIKYHLLMFVCFHFFFFFKISSIALFSLFLIWMNFQMKWKLFKDTHTWRWSIFPLFVCLYCHYITSYYKYTIQWQHKKHWHYVQF
jgi:hypothetical protein